MKEFPHKVEIVGGLRKDSKQKPDTGGLVRSINLKPTEFGLEQITPITTPISTSLDWPFPTLYFGKKHNYLATKTHIYEVETDWSLTEKIEVSTTTPWKFIDYFDYVIFTNKVTTIISNPTTDDLSSGSSPIICRDLCDYRGQIISVEGAGDEGKISWSKIGYADFTVDRYNTAGETYMPYQGALYHCKVLGPYIICYGENGILSLRGVKAPVAGFEIKGIGGVGVLENSLVGDDNIHYFISQEGKLFATLLDQGNLSIKELGYEEFFDNLLEEDIGTTWDSLHKEAYISAEDYNYIITPSGVGEVDRAYTSGGSLGGDLVVMATSEESGYCELETHDVAMNMRAIKQTKVLEIDYLCEEDDIAEASISYKNKRYGDFISLGWKPLNDEGWLIMPTSANFFRYKFRVPMGDSVRISEMMVRWQLDDKRAIRGVYR